jgi:hypothetical protein
LPEVRLDGGRSALQGGADRAIAARVEPGWRSAEQAGSACSDMPSLQSAGVSWAADMTLPYFCLDEKL